MKKEKALLVSARYKKLRQKLGEAAYNQVKKYHNWEIQAEKYLAVYRSIGT